MRIVYLLEGTALWGGVKSVLEAANRLSDRGHDVTIVTLDRAPAWIDLRCELRTVPDFGPRHIPPADVVVGTLWSTVPHAIAAEGAAVHYCQGFEVDRPENKPQRDQIDYVYRRPETHKVTISPHLTRRLGDRYGWRAREIRYAIDHDVMFPREPRPVVKPVRIGLVGPFEVQDKGLTTGLQACLLAQSAGLDLRVVRITNSEPHENERHLPLSFEWHVRVPPRRMGELYSGMDVFVGPTWGADEGFFMPAVEAMACGVPCVLTDVPCHRCYGSGPYALFVPERNHVDLAEAIVVAVGHAVVRSRLRTSGLEVARRYNYDDHVSDLERVFTEICASDRSPVIPVPLTHRAEST